jgi:N-acetylgalactosamine-N,N'-diacetylbacillosaminyl-diphospho-undecaprenol 4-alpha-N-acetylgalactosaminyltransferase
MTGAGEERIASILLRELQYEFNIHLVLFNGPVEYKIPEGQPVFLLRKKYDSRFLRLLTLPLIFFRLRRYCLQHQISVVLSFDTLPNLINCLLKYSKKALSVWLREVNYVSERYGDKKPSSLIHRVLIRKLYPIADKIFVNAERIKQDLTFNYGLNTGQIITMLNPVDINSLKGNLNPVTKTERFTFIHVGAFRPQKNHQLLIEAFEQIRDLEADLWLVGQGPLEGAIREQVEASGMQDQVHFWGFQKNPFDLMRQADCMVLTSDFEGLPNVLIEGLACELPVISTDCLSGPREIIAPALLPENEMIQELTIAEYGLLVPVNNSGILASAMKLMIEDAALRNQYIQYSRQAITRFDTALVIPQLKKLLEEE